MGLSNIKLRNKNATPVVVALARVPFISLEGEHKKTSPEGDAFRKVMTWCTKPVTGRLPTDFDSRTTSRLPTGTTA